MSNHGEYTDGEEDLEDNPEKNYASNPLPREKWPRGSSKGKHTLK